MPPEEINVTVTGAGDPTPEEIAALSEDTRTVADEILEEVKACRVQQSQLMADLESLRGSGSEQAAQREELLTELRNLREENRSLCSELKTLLEANREASSQRADSQSLTPSNSETVVIQTVDPVNVAVPEVQGPKKPKRRVL